MVSQPTARELRGTVLRVMNRASVSAARAPCRRGRWPGRGVRMRRRPAPCRTAPRGRRRRRAPTRSRRAPRLRAAGRATDRCSVGAVRARHSAGVPKRISSVAGHRRELPIEARASGVLEDEPEQHEAKVAVDRPRPGCVLERQRADGLLRYRRGPGGRGRTASMPSGRCSARARSRTRTSRSILAAPSWQPGRHTDPTAAALPVRRAASPASWCDHLGQ